MATNAYYRTALTGGAATALDGIDGATLSDGDFAICMVSSSFYVYKLDASSGASESSPYIISPDSNAGTKRWIQQQVPWVSDTGSMFLTSSLVKDFNQCPWTIGTESLFGVGYSDASPRIALYPFSGADAWTTLANYGAVSQVTTDDTYATILNVASGSGLVYGLVLPGVTNISDTVTVRMTVDGTVYTQAFTLTAVTQRVAMGQTMAKMLDSNITPEPWENGGWVDIAAKLDTSAGVYHMLVHPSQYLGPLVRFETSLLVEMKSSDVTTTNNRDDCAVIYRLD